MKLLDANVIIRFLTRDHKQKAEKCRQLLAEAVSGKIQLFITDLTVAEIVWVLEKVYKRNRTDIRLKIEAILNTPHLIFQNREVVSESIVLYDIYNIDFIDAFQKVFSQKMGIKEIYS